MIDKSLNYGRHLIGEFLSQMSSPNNIVDIGAGQGKDLEIARKIWPNANLIGIESWPSNITKLQNDGVHAISLNLEKDLLPFDKESIDVVIANQILEHCKEIFWIFHEVARTLSVGGGFIVGVPNLASMHNRLLLSFGRQPTQIKTASAHVRGFTKRDITTFLDECWSGGFEVECFGGSNYYPFPPIVARKLAAFFPRSAWGIFFLLRKCKSYHGEFIEYPVREQLETNYWLGGEDKCV